MATKIIRLPQSVDLTPTIALISRNKIFRTGRLMRRSSSSLFHLSSPHISEITVKKSRFLAQAVPLSSASAFPPLLAHYQRATASHNPWAYQLCSTTSRFSDDGEPAGTAGRPILHAINAVGVQNVAVIVTRYFGGVKLGAGGLARAYFEATATCLREADKVEVRDDMLLRVTTDWKWVGGVERVAARWQRVEGSFDSKGGIIVVRVPRSQVDAVVTEMGDACRGKAQVEVMEDE